MNELCLLAFLRAVAVLGTWGGSSLVSWKRRPALLLTDCLPGFLKAELVYTLNLTLLVSSLFLQDSDFLAYVSNCLVESKLSCAFLFDPGKLYSFIFISVSGFPLNDLYLQASSLLGFTFRNRLRVDPSLLPVTNESAIFLWASRFCLCFI